MKNKEYYGKVIMDYEKSNRAYPREMFKDIVAFSNINPDSRLLEIGAGPGTATDGFLEYHVDLMEITEEQTKYLKEKYKDKKNIKTYQTTFELYETDVTYDLIYSGTAFHWIDPAIAYPKAARLLKRGGTLALFWNMTFGIRGVGDYGELQNLEKRYFLSLSDNSNDIFEKRKLEYSSHIYSTGLFTAPVCYEIRFQKIYDVESYLAWIKSRWPKYEELSAREQGGFDKEVRKFFEEKKGSVEIEQRILLILARRNDHNPYQFVDREDIRTIIDIKELARIPHFPECHFLNYADEILYVTDGDGLYGIITPGDIVRYHNGNVPNKINRNFKTISSVEDKEVIEHIFTQFPTIHEIPIAADGKFLGCVKSSKRKTPNEWNHIRKNIRNSCRYNLHQGLNLSALFMSLNEEEQEKLLRTIFAPAHVELYRNYYMIE